MSTKPIGTYGPYATAASSAVVWQLLGNAEGFDTFQFGSVTGFMNVFAAGDGVNFLSATALVLVDLSTGLLVGATQPGKHYAFSGRYKRLFVRQSGATAVNGAYVIASESA